MTTEQPEGAPGVDDDEIAAGQLPAGPVPFYRDPMYLLGAAAVVAGVILWSSRRPRGGGPVYLAKPCPGCGGGSGPAQRINPTEGQQFVDVRSGATVAYHDGHVGPVVDEPAPVSVPPGTVAEPAAGAPVPAAGPGSAGAHDDDTIGAPVDPQALVIAEPADGSLDYAQV